jgi:hypothetical protein
MPECLLWMRRPTPGLLPSKYVAPSWSWAALNGPVSTYFPKGIKGRLESVVVHDCHTKTSKESPFSAVEEGAHLIITAVLVPQTLTGRRKGKSRRKQFHIRNYVDDEEVGLSIYDFAHEKTRDVSGLLLGWEEDGSGDSEYDNLRNKSERALPYYWRNLCGLLVCRVGNVENAYERIGYFELTKIQPGKRCRF